MPFRDNVGPLGQVSLDLDVGTVTGTQALVLEADDGTGHVCTASVDVVVDPPPVLIVTSPADQASVPVGRPLTIVVRVADLRTTDPTRIAIAVVSDVDGPLGVIGGGMDGTRALPTSSPASAVVTRRMTHTKGVSSLAQRRAEAMVIPRKRMPPMVGVPALAPCNS